MFCPRCGVAVGDVAAACPSCSTPIREATAPAGAILGTLQEAVASLRSFAGDPVGRLAPACESLGDARARHVGIAFGTAATAGFLLGGYLSLPAFARREIFEVLGFGGMGKSLAFAVVPFACVAVGGHAMRRLFGGKGSAGSDCFLAGAAVLPAAIAMILNGILGLENAALVKGVSVLAGCTSILMLHAGFTRISKLSDRAATVSVPTVVLLGVWLARMLAASVLEGPGSSDPLPGFPWR